MNHIEELLVVKRSGEVVGFDSQRINNAITAAINASDEKYDSAKINEIVEASSSNIFKNLLDKHWTSYFYDLSITSKCTCPIMQVHGE